MLQTAMGPRGSCNLFENRAHMVASVPALTCHVTVVMGLSMAAPTTGSQEARFLRLLRKRMKTWSHDLTGGGACGGQRVSLQVHALSHGGTFFFLPRDPDEFKAH